MLDGLGQLADYFGYNRVMGKMYGALLLSPEPMSLDDVAKALSASNAVSTNLDSLLTELQEHADRWAVLLEIEAEAAARPGFVDGGTHLIVAARAS